MANTRKNTAAQWVAENPTLRLGELGLEKDTQKLKVGDGVTPWTNLSYQFNKAMADAIYASLTGSVLVRKHDGTMLGSNKVVVLTLTEDQTDISDIAVYDSIEEVGS